MAETQSEPYPPSRLTLATNEYLIGQRLRDPSSRYMATVLGTCDRGIIVVLGTPRFGQTTSERAQIWDNLTINRALLKTFGRKVRRA